MLYLSSIIWFNLQNNLLLKILNYALNSVKICKTEETIDLIVLPDHIPQKEKNRVWMFHHLIFATKSISSHASGVIGPK